MKLKAGVVAAAVVVAAVGVSHGTLVARAATFTVNTTADTPDVTPGDGVCDDSAGHCSLHAAIDDTNLLGGTNQINLPAGTYLLSLPGATVSGQSLTIAGAGASTTIIDGNHSSTVGTPLTAGGGATLFISGITIQNGAAGGIVANGSLIVSSMVFLNNTASLDGGGVAIFSSAASIQNSRFSGNSVTQSTGIGGGAISNHTGSLSVVSSTLDHNTSAGYGGGISAGGLTILTNVTITANSANGAGGGGVATFSNSNLTINHGTIDANVSGSDGGGIESYVSGSNKYVQVKNSIVSGNTAAVSGANCFGAQGISSQGYNIDSGSTCSFAATGDQSNVDPALGALQANGGPTPTQAIGSGSAALDKGSPDCTAPDQDQRGFPRPMGLACDVGSYEYQPPAIASFPAVMNNAYGGYSTTSYIRNNGVAAAGVDIIYYDQGGNFVGMDWTPNLAPNATWIVSQTHTLTSGFAGSALVYSTQPISSFVNEFHASLDGSSYTGNPIMMGGTTTLYAPAIANNAYGGYTTGIGMVNEGAAPTNVTVTYYTAAGTVQATQTVTGMAPHAYRAFYSGDATLALPSGFAGTAIMQSSSSPISAVVNETGPGGQFSSYDASSNPASTLVAPIALNNAYGGFNTGMGVQNTTSGSATFVISYYNGAGTLVASTSHPIAAFGYAGVYQPADLSMTGAFSAVISSSVSLAVIVNETAPVTGAERQSTGYNTAPIYSSLVNLPMVESSGSDLWSTGEGIVNTGITTVTVTVSYFDVVTGAPTGTAQMAMLAPNAYLGVYQPAGGLPAGTRASASVSAPGGSVVVVCNESNSTSFMSHGGQ